MCPSFLAHLVCGGWAAEATGARGHRAAKVHPQSTLMARDPPEPLQAAQVVSKQRCPA